MGALMLDMALDPDVAAADQDRGHTFQPPDEILRGIPQIGATTDTANVEELTVHAVYYMGAPEVLSWGVIELDPETWRARCVLVDPYHLVEKGGAGVAFIESDLTELAVVFGMFAVMADGADPDVTEPEPVKRLTTWEPTRLGDMGEGV